MLAVSAVSTVLPVSVRSLGEALHHGRAPNAPLGGGREAQDKGREQLLDPQHVCPARCKVECDVGEAVVPGRHGGALGRRRRWRRLALPLLLAGDRRRGGDLSPDHEFCVPVEVARSLDSEGVHGVVGHRLVLHLLAEALDVDHEQALVCQEVHVASHAEGHQDPLLTTGLEHSVVADVLLGADWVDLHVVVSQPMENVHDRPVVRKLRQGGLSLPAGGRDPQYLVRQEQLDALDVGPARSQVLFEVCDAGDLGPDPQLCVKVEGACRLHGEGLDDLIGDDLVVYAGPGDALHVDAHETPRGQESSVPAHLEGHEDPLVLAQESDALAEIPLNVLSIYLGRVAAQPSDAIAQPPLRAVGRGVGRDVQEGPPLERWHPQAHNLLREEAAHVVDVDLLRAIALAEAEPDRRAPGNVSVKHQVVFHVGPHARRLDSVRLDGLIGHAVVCDLLARPEALGAEDYAVVREVYLVPADLEGHSDSLAWGEDPRALPAYFRLRRRGIDLDGVVAEPSPEARRRTGLIHLRGDASRPRHGRQAPGEDGAGCETPQRHGLNRTERRWASGQTTDVVLQPKQQRSIMRK
mmetsp:Transcript_128542/g.400042  ORF Transcript_128542/g.400042 Transcript_128542/m.400042 type:complete len:579 (+) Transcript_128542:1086-2822(+)